MLSRVPIVPIVLGKFLFKLLIVNFVSPDESYTAYEVIISFFNDVNFASELRSVFETINDNFARLSNHDFIKGESGTSVYIKEEPIYNGSTLSTFGNNLRNYLKSLING